MHQRVGTSAGAVHASMKHTTGCAELVPDWFRVGAAARRLGGDHCFGSPRRRDMRGEQKMAEGLDVD